MMGWDLNQILPCNGGWVRGVIMQGGLGMLAFWGLLIVLVVWGVRALGSGTGRSMPPSGPASGAPPTPMEIAQARYARGEISRDEFETIRRDLQGSA